MPRFYFDINDGVERTSDDKGLDLVDFDAAKEEAQKTLTELARHADPIADQRVFTVCIRDFMRTIVCRATLTLRVTYFARIGPRPED